MKHYILRIMQHDGFCAGHIVIRESDLEAQLARWKPALGFRGAYIEIIEAYDENEALQLKEALKRGVVPAYLAREMLIFDESGEMKRKYTHCQVYKERSQNAIN